MAHNEGADNKLNVKVIEIVEKPSTLDPLIDPLLSGSAIIYLSGGALWFNGTSKTATRLGAA